MKTIPWVAAAAAVAVVVVAVQFMAHAEGIGVNWGTQASQNLHPEMIIQMLQDNQIYKIKLFDSDYNTVKYFAKTGIEVMLGIPNNHLADLAADYNNAQDWVHVNLTQAYNDGVKIRHVAVGNEPFLTSYNGSNMKTLFPAMQNIQSAINNAGLGDKVKVTTPQNADVYESGDDGPSAGDFRSDIRSLMKDIVRFLRDNNSPFLVNIYPFLSLYQNAGFPVDFAFFSGGAKPVQDNNISYTNMLDANLDTLVWSLRKAGAQQVQIIIGEIGWPTDGDVQANVSMAKRFYDGFLKKMATKKGTPLYPKDLEYYLFSLTDENQKSIAPGDFERHWGVFRYDGQPKFPMDFRGGGGDGDGVMPVGAKNVKYMPSKWCIFNSDVRSMENVPRNVDYACGSSDCTGLSHGGPCSKMDDVTRATYAFNMFFQMNGQHDYACDFDGLARIVETNASTQHCLFPVALQTGGGSRILVRVGSGILCALLLMLLFN